MGRGLIAADEHAIASGVLGGLLRKLNGSLIRVGRHAKEPVAVDVNLALFIRLNADFLVLVAAVLVRNQLAVLIVLEHVSGTLPVGLAAIEHLVADEHAGSSLIIFIRSRAGGKNILGILLEACVVLPQLVTIGSAAASTLVALGVGIAFGRVPGNQRAVLHIDDGLAMDAGSNTAAQAIGHIVGNHSILEGQLTFGLNVDAAAAKIAGGLGFVVGDVALGDGAGTLDIDTAAFAIMRDVSVNSAAVHGEVRLLVTVGVALAIVDEDTAALTGFILGDRAAAHVEVTLVTEHINAAALTVGSASRIEATFIQAGLVAGDGTAGHVEGAVVHRNAAAVGGGGIVLNGTATHVEGTLHQNAAALIAASGTVP